MITQMFEAIADVEMWNLHAEHMVILAPPGTLEKLVSEELINGKTEPFCLGQLRASGETCSRFGNILFIEDEALTQVVVRSTVSDHRAVVQQ